MWYLLSCTVNGSPVSHNLGKAEALNNHEDLTVFQQLL